MCPDASGEQGRSNSPERDRDTQTGAARLCSRASGDQHALEEQTSRAGGWGPARLSPAMISFGWKRRAFSSSWS